ncbi:hypothetical protein [Flavobacterium ginsenosidimutans]|uniref:DUF3592 domain-containing protein n=1 Tax=Flavobacterium ginsenosidimutans TaxID=687844 RepID=A0ABZ2Q785_9FLAO
MALRKKRTLKKSHFKEYRKDYAKFLIVLCFIVFIFRKPLLYLLILDLFSTEKTIAYVTDEKNYERRGHLTNEFTYSYNFRYENINYSQNSNIKGLKVGDSLIIEFNKYIPSINRIISSQ